MSQVKFKSECRTYTNHGLDPSGWGIRTEPHSKPVEVMAGWDRPLGHYYMTVFDLSPDADQETIWSTLDTREGGYPSCDFLFEKLFMLGIDVPKGFWDRVEMREGNVVTTYVDGEWRRKEF